MIVVSLEPDTLSTPLASYFISQEKYRIPKMTFLHKALALQSFKFSSNLMDIQCSHRNLNALLIPSLFDPALQITSSAISFSIQVSMPMLHFFFLPHSRLYQDL